MMRTISGAILVLSGVIAVVGAEMSQAAWAAVAGSREIFKEIDRADVGTLHFHYRETPNFLFFFGIALCVFGFALIFWGLIQDLLPPPRQPPK